TEWIPDPTQPARLQGEVGYGYPGVPEGQTAPYTSSEIAYLAALVFETASGKLITVCWGDLSIEERKAFGPLFKLLALKEKPAPAGEGVGGGGGGVAGGGAVGAGGGGVVAGREGVVAGGEGGGTDDALSDGSSAVPPPFGTRVPPGLLTQSDDPPTVEPTDPP